MIREHNGKKPRIAPTAFVWDTAEVIGEVELGEEVSVWPGVVLRGDVEPIRIGSRTNIQDNSVLHTREGHPTVVGEGCTVGHMAILHGTKIGANTLIGMGAICLEAEIGENCIVGAGALVPAGTRVPAGSLVLGVPAKVARGLTPEEIAQNRESAEHYVQYAKRHRRTTRRLLG